MMKYNWLFIISGILLVASGLILFLLLSMPVGEVVDQDDQVTAVISSDSEYRYITANGIPDHEVGEFPNPDNPNTISSQDYQFRVPLEPTLANVTTELGLFPFGVALNGIPFDPAAGEFWNEDPGSGWQYEALSGAIELGLDDNNASVHPDGAYHYLAFPTGFFEEELPSDEHSPLVGYAADGFPIYALYGYANPGGGVVRELSSSFHLRIGVRASGPGGEFDGTFEQDYEYLPGFGDLDECNGRETVTPEYPQGIYSYFITDDYPYIPRCFKGTPDSSFLQK